MGKYRTRGDGEKAWNCHSCPDGFTSHRLNVRTCVLKEMDTPLYPHPCPNGTFIHMPDAIWEVGRTNAIGGTTPAPRGKAVCLACPKGKYSVNMDDTECHIEDDSIKVVTHTEQTNAPTGLPTFRPTDAPTVASCTTECATDLAHDNLQAKCLACRGHMTLEKFCAIYPIISGC